MAAPTAAETRLAERFAGRVGLQQRVLPAYRAPLFDALARLCDGGLSVFAGQPLPAEQIATTQELQAARYAPARNRHLFSAGSPFYQCWQPGILDWLDAWQPDVLIVEANPRYRSTPSAVRWMHARHRPVLGWGLGAPPLGGLIGSWQGRLRQSFLRSLDGVVAYSRRGAQEYIAAGLPPERVFVAANAATHRPAAPPPSRPPQFVGPPVVLFVGRLQARKRIDNLLRACAALPPAQQPRLWIVGDGPARADFQALSQQVYPAAEFFGDRRGPELEDLFRAADLFVLPGTGGLAVQQAMAFGLPVIVAQGDGTQDDLVRTAAPDPNGWIVPPDDLPALTAALQAALSDASLLRRMGASAFRVVAEEVNLEAMAAVFVRALNAVTANLPRD